jgi:hypothetical protein
VGALWRRRESDLGHFLLKGGSMEQAIKQAYGNIRDAKHNGKYVREMLTQVENYLVEITADSDAEMCRNIMFIAGLQNAIQTMDNGVLDFIEKAIGRFEAAKDTTAALEGGAA